MAVDIKPQSAEQAEMLIEMAVQGWWRKKAQIRMTEYVRLLGQEWSKQDSYPGEHDVTRQLQMKVAEAMWRSQGVQSERGDIGCEGLRGDNGVIWRAQGETASTDMREWIDHLAQVRLNDTGVQ